MKFTSKHATHLQKFSWKGSILVYYDELSVPAEWIARWVSAYVVLQDIFAVAPAQLLVHMHFSVNADVFWYRHWWCPVDGSEGRLIPSIAYHEKKETKRKNKQSEEFSIHQAALSISEICGVNENKVKSFILSTIYTILDLKNHQRNWLTAGMERG